MMNLKTTTRGTDEGHMDATPFTTNPSNADPANSISLCRALLYLVKLGCDRAVQYLPPWFIRHWPLNKWYHVSTDWENMLLEHRPGVDWIVDNRTGIHYKGSKKVQ